MATGQRSDRPVELTARALATGVVLGMLLTPCNVYSGLKIGWSFNMSIAALLMGYMFWAALVRIAGVRKWGLHESNISQTTASSAASIISGGLVAPLPALALLTGDNLPWDLLVVWVFGVSFLGIWVGWYLRESLVVQSSLAFPAGMATAATMRDIFSDGREGALKVRALLASLFSAIAANSIDKFLWLIPRWSPTISSQKLTFYVDPSFMLLGFGALIGLRAGLSLLIGAVLAWGILAPQLIASGAVVVSHDSQSWFQPLVSWLLWPGVALMLTSSLLTVVIAFRKSRQHSRGPLVPLTQEGSKFRLVGLLVAASLVVVLQVVIFDIHWVMALLAVPMAFLLASVAARVTGETGIAPIGAIGKVSQVSFGVISPTEPATNLMTANVAGGVAGQSADLLNDLKAGYEIGATPKLQIIAQCFGVLAGSIAGSFIYLALIPAPMEQLITPEWPAPAAAVWKAVADMLAAGINQTSGGAIMAAVWAGLLGLALTLAAEYAPRRWQSWIPSGSAVGLAFVIPAATSITMFVGAALAAVFYKALPRWSGRFLLSIAAGLVAGESLFGIVAAIF